MALKNERPCGAAERRSDHGVRVALPHLKLRKRWPWPKHLFADAGYDRTKLLDKAAFLDFVVEIVRRCDKAAGFEAIPRRWVVERSFGRMIRWRRLVRGHEKRHDVSEARIHVATGGLLLRRVAHRVLSSRP